jgi:hypothetical protein
VPSRRLRRSGVTCGLIPFLRLRAFALAPDRLRFPRSPRIRRYVPGRTSSRRTCRLPCLGSHACGSLPLGVGGSVVTHLLAPPARVVPAARRAARAAREPSSLDPRRLAVPRAHRAPSPGLPDACSKDGRLPWGFLPFGACGGGQRLLPGLPPPATRRPRASSAPRRFAPPLPSPAFFHAGNALGLCALRGFPSPVASAPLGGACPSCRFRRFGFAIGQDGRCTDRGFRGSCIR